MSIRQIVGGPRRCRSSRHPLLVLADGASANDIGLLFCEYISVRSISIATRLDIKAASVMHRCDLAVIKMQRASPGIAMVAAVVAAVVCTMQAIGLMMVIFAMLYRIETHAHAHGAMMVVLQHCAHHKHQYCCANQRYPSLRFHTTPLYFWHPASHAVRPDDACIVDTN